jgi:hypothetical protein
VNARDKRGDDVPDFWRRRHGPAVLVASLGYRAALLDWLPSRVLLQAEQKPVSRTTLVPRAPELPVLTSRYIAAPATGALAWMAAAFVVSLALSAIVLAIFGAGEHGTTLALRVTARWCFLLFLLAYAGSAVTRFCGPRFAVLARHGRDLGLAFAAALFVHIGLVLWLFTIAADQRTLMLFFWAGVLATCALSLFSLRRLRDRLGPRLWRILSEAAMQYIALVFAADFIVEPLKVSGADAYPLSYVPFAVLLFGGVVLRLAAQMRRLPAASSA